MVANDAVNNASTDSIGLIAPEPLGVHERHDPNTAAVSTSPGLIAREHELELVDELLDSATDTDAGLFVRGEPGVGKTALLLETIARAERRGFRTLRASGVQFEADLAFSGLHQLLRPVVGRVEALSPPQRDALRATFGFESTGAPDLFLIGLATLNLLSDCADEAPILIAVDDCHWLDKSTCDVLAFIARRLQADPIRVVAATRDADVTPLDTCGLREIRLGPLDATDAETLLDTHAPALTQNTRTRFLVEAAGNPLALVELPNTLVTFDADQALPDWLPLSAHLEQTFAARQEQLPPKTQMLLLVAALDERLALGEALSAASAVAGSDVTLDDLGPAVCARLIEVVEERVRFRHPLMRSAIRQAASVSERHAAHAALAMTLADVSERQVWHRAASALGPDEAIAAELERMADGAARRGAPVEAAAALDRAAALSPNPKCRAGRLLRAAELAVGLGQRDLVTRVIREAKTLGLNPLDQARLALVRETFEPGIDGDQPRVLGLVEHAGDAAETDANLALHLLLAAAANSFWADRSSETHDAIKSATQAIAVEPDDPRALAILAFIAPATDVPSVVERIGNLAGDETLSPDELQLLGGAAFILCAHELSSDFHTASVDGLRAQGRLERLAQSLVMRAWCQIHLGRWDIAAPDAEEALRLSEETGQPIWLAGAQAALAWLAAVRGQEAEAEKLAAAAESVVVPAGSRAVFSVVQLTRGMLEVSAGRNAEAYEHLRRMMKGDDLANHRMTSAWGIGSLAEAAVYGGSADEARVLIDAIDAAGERATSGVTIRAMAHAQALLAEDNDAEALFDSALADPTLPPFGRARLQLALGIWLRRQRRVVEAREELRAARGTFDALGALPWGERTRQELRATGESSNRRTPDARDKLTTQELQVAQMAATGLSNREIGQKLYLSHRTISSHLYRIFPKLGISARSELSAALAGSEAI